LIPAAKPNSIVFVIDDDSPMREAIKRLLSAVDIAVQTFSSGQEFLRSNLPDVPSCVVLDVRLPDVSGLDLQQEMVDKGIHAPIIFITGHGDIRMSVQAMKAGAIEFLTKPFRDQDLLDAIHLALRRDRAGRKQRGEIQELREHFSTLTARERDVMSRVVAGRLNKQIAYEFGASEKTIKVHRGQVMKKMCANSLAELVRMSQKLGIDNSKP